VAQLTSKEQEVLGLIGRGLTCEQIAASLSISTYTVRKHRSNILRKLDLHATAQLVAHAASSLRAAAAAPPATEVFAGLTPRELQVAQLITQGFTGKEIARQLGISPGTVRKHRDNIANRAGLRSIADIILRAANPPDG
jgi:DNA-binding NarL/FixJ family response regulator